MELLITNRNSISFPPDLSSLPPSLLSSAKALLSSNNINKEGFKTSILNLIFPTIEKKDNFFLEKGPPKLICGKIIKFKDVAFKCLDCEKDETCIICQECFENSDHKGHRIIPTQACGGCCDCGDEEAWKKEGFCSMHKGYSAQKSEVGVQVDDEVQKNIKNTFKAIFYCIFENAESFLLEKDDQHSYLELSKMLMETILVMRHLIGGNWGVNTCIFELLSMPFHDQKMKLFHDCNVRETIKIKDEEMECSCSILENICRFILLFEKRAVKETIDLFITLFPNYQFKIYLTRTYALMFNNFYSCTQYFFSSILDISVQLFTSDEICKSLIEKNDMNSFFSFLSLLFENIEKKMGMVDSGKVSVNIRQTLAHFEFMIQKASSAKALSLSNIFWRQIFICLFYLTNQINFEKNNNNNKKQNQKKKEAFSDLNFIDVELSLLKIVKETLKHVNDESVLEMIFAILIELINKKSKNDSKKNCYSFHNSLNRALSIIFNKILHFNQFENLDYLLVLLTKTFGDNNDELSFFLNFVSKSTLKTIEFIKKLEIDLWKPPNEEYILYSKVYYIAKYYFYDCDLFLIQIILIISRGNLMETIFSNFQLKSEYQLTEKSKEIDYNALESCLLFLIEIYENKLSLYNVGEFLIGNALFQVEKEKHWANALQNYIYKNEEINLKLIKKDFIGSFVMDDPNLETILDKIADFNDKKKVFKLKEDKNFIYNPFIFSRNIKLFFEFSNTKASEKPNHSSLCQQLDLKKKSFFYLTMKYSLNFMTELSMKLLRENKDLIFKNQNLRSIILKIINDKLNFHMMKKKKVSSNLEIFDELMKIFQDARNSVYFIENSRDFNCLLGKISEICNKTSGIEIESTAEKTISNSKLDEKRLQMLKRQSEIKKKFEEKQKKFLLNERHEIQSKKDELDLEKICVVCKDSIYFNEEFGGFCYFSKSNLIQHAYSQYFTKASLLYDAKEIEELSKIENWGEFDGLPTFSNCQHFIHEKCYENFSAYNKRGKSLFLNNCPLCARCFNLYLPNMDEKEATLGEKKMGVDIFVRIHKIDKELFKPLDPLEAIQRTDKSALDFFNNILSLVLLYPNSSQEDDLVLSFIEKTFISLNYFSDLTGIFYMIQAKLELYKNFKRIADLFVSSFISRAEKQNQKKKIDFVYNTLRLFDIECWNIGEDLDFIFIKFVIYYHFYFIRKEEFQFICKNLFCQIIVLKCVQTVIYNEEVLCPKTELSSEYLISLLLAAPKKTLLSLLKRQLLINAIFFGEKLEIDELLFNELTTEQEEFNYLCELNKLDFKSIIQNYIEESYEKMIIFFKKHHEILMLNVPDKRKSLINLNESLVNFQLCFNLTNLDPQFSNVHSSYSTKKCDLCNDYPHFGQLYLCLICGATICSMICILKDKNSILNGNLNEHSQKFHDGNSIFISTLNGAILYVASPQNFLLEVGLYHDRFGEKIKIKQQKLDTYFLDVDEYNKVKEMIVRNEIEEKIETLSRKEGIKYQLNYF